MKISSFDLNLFVILNAIYTEGSLTKAAEVVGITKPAVSNALSRLREKFNDDLFVRTGSGMIPTQKTENIITDVQNALTLIQQSVNEPDTFDQKHLHVSNRRRGLHLIDTELEKIGYRREVALRCQHFLIAPTIIQSTDLVLMGTRSFANRNNLPFAEIPLDIPSMEYFLIWHKNDEGDGGHIWMKDLIVRAFKHAQR